MLRTACSGWPLKEAAEGFGREFRRAFPEQHVPLKVHMIEEHMVEWAEQWHSTGMFSEDAAESIHAMMVKLERRYACIRGRIERNKAVRGALEIKQNFGS